MDVVCCVCHRVRKNGEWVEKRLPDESLASHGYCPECAAVARVELVLLRLKDMKLPVSRSAVA